MAESILHFHIGAAYRDCLQRLSAWSPWFPVLALLFHLLPFICSRTANFVDGFARDSLSDAFVVQVLET